MRNRLSLFVANVLFAVAAVFIHLSVFINRLADKAAVRLTTKAYELLFRFGTNEQIFTTLNMHLAPLGIRIRPEEAREVVGSMIGDSALVNMTRGQTPN